MGEIATQYRKTISLLWDQRFRHEERGLIIYGGQIIADLEDTLLDLTGDEAGQDTYAQIVNKHFLPRKNKDFARFQIGNLKQNNGESLSRYYTHIREIAKKCSFSNESEAIRDHVINNVVRIKAIRKNWTLDQILEETELDDETRAQAKEMEKKVQSDETIKRARNYRRQRRRPSISPTRGKTTNPCNRCGYDRTHKQCPAMGSLCKACGKRNHYARVCRSKSAERFTRGRRQRQFEGKDLYKRRITISIERRKSERQRKIRS